MLRNRMILERVVDMMGMAYGMSQGTHTQCVMMRKREHDQIKSYIHSLHILTDIRQVSTDRTHSTH